MRETNRGSLIPFYRRFQRVAQTNRISLLRVTVTSMTIPDSRLMCGVAFRKCLAGTCGEMR